MVVLAQVVVMEVDQGLDGLLHRAELDQRHLSVLPVGEETERERKLLDHNNRENQECRQSAERTP